MKKDIHPKSNLVTVTCSCGHVFTTGSTFHGDMKVETCSKCHPHYTGEKRILRTSSVDKFLARQKKTETLQK